MGLFLVQLEQNGGFGLFSNRASFGRGSLLEVSCDATLETVGLYKWDIAGIWS